MPCQQAQEPFPRFHGLIGFNLVNGFDSIFVLAETGEIFGRAPSLFFRPVFTLLVTQPDERDAKKLPCVCGPPGSALTSGDGRRQRRRCGATA